MSEKGIRALTKTEYQWVWDKFYDRFDFKPSIHRFPGITEPTVSMTWSLTAFDNDPEYRQLDRLVNIVHAGLAGAATSGEQLWLLDWQHTCYRLPAAALDDTDAVRGTGLSPYPDGDYHIYLASDLRFGSFGHPWEQTLCLFGEPLLNIVAADIGTVLGSPVRIGGRKPGDQP